VALTSNLDNIWNGQPGSIAKVFYEYFGLVKP